MYKKQFLFLFVLLSFSAHAQESNFTFEYHVTHVIPVSLADKFEKNGNTSKLPFTTSQLDQIDGFINNQTPVYELRYTPKSSLYLHTDVVYQKGYEPASKEKMDIGGIWHFKKEFGTQTLQMQGGGINEGTCTKPKKLNELVNWKFEKGDSTINTYKCKKAIDQVSGAVAWYTLSLPISDGPKHFSGLPGLIVLLLDESKNKRIELVKVTKIEEIKLEEYECKEEISYESYAGKKKDFQLLNKKPSVEIKND